MCQKQAGAGLGAIAAAAAAGPSVWSVLGGAAGGSVVGIIAHMAAPVAKAAELPSGSAQSQACHWQPTTLVHCVAVAELGGAVANPWHCTLACSQRNLQGWEAVHVHVLAAQRSNEGNSMGGVRTDITSNCPKHPLTHLLCPK